MNARIAKRAACRVVAEQINGWSPKDERSLTAALLALHDEMARRGSEPVAHEGEEEK